MKNNKIIGCLLGLLFVLMSVGEVKAQFDCSNCLAHSPNSYFCNNSGYLYYKEGNDTCFPFKFIGLNVKALSRLNISDLEEVLKEASNMGVTVIRFSAANGNIGTTTAVQKVMSVLDYARGSTNAGIRNMKFIITLADFHGNPGTYNNTNDPGNTDGKGVYYPLLSYVSGNTSPAPNPYIVVDGTEVLHPDFFRPTEGEFTQESIFYQNAYKAWVQKVITGLQDNPDRQKQILSLELCNDLSNIAEPNGGNMERIRSFIQYMTNFVKSELPLLVSIGNTSTHHTLNGDLDASNLSEFRDDIYLTTNTPIEDRYAKIDFMTIHNYNNEWSQSNKQFRGYLRQDEDIEYAKANNIPIVVEEFGFAGNTTTTEAFGGGCWDRDDYYSHEIPEVIPPNRDDDDNSNNSPTYDRACAIGKGIDNFWGDKVSGVVAADFNPFSENKGLGGEGAELDIRSEDYNYVKQTWTLRASWPYTNPFQENFYECQPDMVIDGILTGAQNTVCESPGSITVAQKVGPNFSIAYNSGEDVTFLPSESNPEEGADIEEGSDVTADIILIDCVDCPTAPSCSLPTDCCGDEEEDKNKASYWRCVSYTEAGIIDWNISKGLDYNMYNCVNAWNYYATVYNKNPDKFLWVGFAKLAGDFFYEGFQDIHVARKALETDASMSQLVSNVDIPIQLTQYDDEIIDKLNGLADHLYSKQALIDHLWLIERTFLTMQQQIFDDIVWQHLAYHHGSQNGGNGFEFLENILRNDPEYKNKYPQEVIGELIETWRRIHNSTHRTDDNAKAGLIGIANLEQNHVIADTYDEMRGYNRRWHIGDNGIMQTIFETLSYITESPINAADLSGPDGIPHGGIPLREVCDIPNACDNLPTCGSFIFNANSYLNVTCRDDRWAWIENDMAPKFSANIKDNLTQTQKVINTPIHISNHNDHRLLPNNLYPFPLSTTDIRIRDTKECNGETRTPALKEQTPLENDQYQFTIQPNPFNTQTEIVFNLTEDAPVTIRVTDMMGKRKATLAEYELRTAGQHTVIFDGSSYPAGMYMTHIQVGEYSGTQKMILAK